MTRANLTTYPAFANCHSHVFHRALRGRRPGGSDFWGWREGMYQVADVLDPDLYYRLARATYAEMALAGIGAVGEFHYLHHGPGGIPYSDRHAMAEAVIAAAGEVGLRICLLHTCYLRAGFGLSLIHICFLDLHRNRGLPPFLADDPGIDSGLMIAQYTQAGIVSALKRLAVPASVDSIPSSALPVSYTHLGRHLLRR